MGNVERGSRSTPENDAPGGRTPDHLVSVPGRLSKYWRNGALGGTILELFWVNFWQVRICLNSQRGYREFCICRACKSQIRLETG